MKPVLTARDITIGYKQGKHERVVAENVSVSLLTGELVCLLGVNGAGKSTLMRTLAGMLSSLSGDVFIDGRNLRSLSAAELARIVSVVLTERVDPGLLRVYDLVSLGRHPYTNWMGHLTSNDHQAVRGAISAAGANSLADRYVHELSDGERQKVMIARALAQGSQLMLLDEPTAFLDLPRRVEILHMLRRLAHTENRAVLLSTHDLDLALRTADRVWLLTADGRLHMGAPEDLVIGGAFGDAFRDNGVVFNLESGSFSLHSETSWSVDVLGRGIEAEWTRRSLERIGFRVVRGAPDAVEVIHDQSSVRWHGFINGVHNEWISIYSMAAQLKQLNIGTRDAKESAALSL
jgi:iron complex transport system ATP-binding protein